MANELYLLGAVVLVSAAYVIRQLVVFHKFGGTMLVTCPETGKPAAVKVATWRSVWAAIRGRRQMELSECSRWPERQDCPQDRLCQIEANPKEHQLWTIAAKWFEGKTCVYCSHIIGPVKHLDRPPALLNPDKETLEWENIPPEKLPEAFDASVPVCWNCHIAEKFIREHRDRVTFRPWEKSGPLGEYAPDKPEDDKTAHRHAA
ncbi:MAG TPA: hypothetical protein VJW51_12910 [Candidatus Acidoferrales bacterium]|nr:hypothetical protein [Candidatus Acidoferrales bacterium]